MQSQKPNSGGQGSNGKPAKKGLGGLRRIMSTRGGNLKRTESNLSNSSFLTPPRASMSTTSGNKTRLNRNNVSPSNVMSLKTMLLSPPNSVSASKTLRGTTSKAGKTMRKKYVDNIMVDRRSIHSKFSFSALSLANNPSELIDAACELVLQSYLMMSKRSKTIAEKNGPALNEAIRAFVSLVYSKYTQSKFHSFIHAVDVSQMMFTFITDYFDKNLSPDESFYLIVSCLCHDIAHPGGTTNFLRNNNMLSSDDSLEDFHIQQTQALISDGNLELFEVPFITPEQKRKLLIYSRYLIEATDISLDARFREAAEKVVRRNNSLPMEYLAILIKVSDLANVVRDFDDAFQWSQRLNIEISAEAKFENTDQNFALDLEAESKIQEKQLRLEHKAKTFQTVGTTLSALQDQQGPIDNLKTTLSKSTMTFIQRNVKPLATILLKISEDAGNAYSARLRENQLNWSNISRF